MVLDFTLRRGVNAYSPTDGLTVVQRLKSPIILAASSTEQKEALQRLWIVDRHRNLQSFKLEIVKYFSEEDRFHLLVPFSHNDYFTNQIREFIIASFPNCIDISNCFTKEEGISFGSEPYASQTIGELSEYIHVNECIGDYNDVSKVLIADDVYSQGKTMDVYECILTQQFGNIQIVGGTLISTN